MLSLVRSRAFRPATGGLSLSKRTLVLGSAPRLAREAPLDGLQQIIPGTEIQRDITPATKATGLPYWQRIPRWRDITEEQFKSYSWQLANSLNTQDRLFKFLKEVVPERLEDSKNARLRHINTKDEFIDDAMEGLKKAPMAVRLTPHVCSVIQWERALDDPIRLQFLPLNSSLVEDHPNLKLDSLNEKNDSPVQGLVHRYPDKVLFLANSVCPVYCRFCTRSYAVGGPTDTVNKDPVRPSRRRWQRLYDYIADTPAVSDVVVSGGDTFYLAPENIKEIGETLLNIEHVRRVRFASRGLAAAPMRILDPNDDWTSTLIELSKLGRRLGKQVCLHTHIDHPNEITWITEAAAHHLFENGVIVRNQSVLLKGVNDDVKTMGTLIRSLADMNIQPYYVYQCDLVKGVEDLRTPLKVILNLEQQLRGTIAGFMMPSFVVDLPGGGGKRLAAAHEKYDPATGISTFKAPGLHGEKGQRIYEYYDPKPVVEKPREALRIVPAQKPKIQELVLPQTKIGPAHITPCSQPALSRAPAMLASKGGV